MRGTILHVGLHKTGTTALQDALAGHRNTLARLGLNYPQDPGGASGHHAIACSLSDPNTPAGVNDLFRPERETFALKTGARQAGRVALSDLPLQDRERTILSSEIFCTFDGPEIAALETFAAPIERCVAYVRDGIGFIHACWSTKVRWGYRQDFDHFLAAATGRTNSCLQGPISYFDLLLERFGEDRLRIRSYDAALTHPRGIAGDFLEAELGVQGLELVAAAANVSPSAGFTELARAIAFEASDDTGRDARATLGRFSALAGSSKGHDLVATLLPVVEQAMRTVCVADVRIDGGVVRADGSLSVETPSLAEKLTAWRFPVLETCRYARLEELQALLEGVPEYDRLVQALKFADETVRP